MDIRNSVGRIEIASGSASAAPAAAPQAKSGGRPTGSALVSDHATLSNAGSEVSQTASEDGVRAEKVAAMQAALAAGTYNVPASAVASKVVDAMLGRRVGAGTRRRRRRG